MERKKKMYEERRRQEEMQRLAREAKERRASHEALDQLMAPRSQATKSAAPAMGGVRKPPRRKEVSKLTAQRKELMIACGAGWLGEVAELLAKKCPVNWVDKAGISPLYSACGNGYAKIVAKLIAANADVEKGTSPTMKGATSLFIACHRGRTEIVAILLAAKADVDHSDDRGFTPLLVACEKRRATIVANLLAANADVNQLHRRQGPLPQCPTCNQAFTSHQRVYG